MKQNAILLAGIMFVAGSAAAQVAPESNHGQQLKSGHSSLNAPDECITDPASAGGLSGTVSGSVSSSYSDSDKSADSSERGGSLQARGIEEAPDLNRIEDMPLDPLTEADSSVRGGSVGAQQDVEEFKSDLEDPSDPITDTEIRADSSVRGGSLETRAEPEEVWEKDLLILGKDDDEFHLGEQGRGDFGQGSSATWQSDKAGGSIIGSANWNPSDDMLRDGIGVESDSTAEYEFRSETGVGGAAQSETGSRSSAELETEEAYSSGFETDFDSELEMRDLNTSDQLEENISGDFDIQERSEILEGSSNSSLRTSDLSHRKADLNTTYEFEGEDMEAAGAAASSETGTSTSSDFDESKDDALNSTESPLGRSENEPNWLDKDNPAQGVGSLATGEFGSAASGQLDGSMSDERLAEQVKTRLVTESTGITGLMRTEVAKNIDVSASNGEITLNGNVPSEREKQMLEIRVSEMEGVKKVHNELSVTAESEPGYRALEERMESSKRSR